MNADAQTELIDALKDAATAFAQKELGAERIRTTRSMAGGFDIAKYRQVAALGWTGILIPEEYGGSGMGLPELAAVGQTLASRLFPEPLVDCAAFAAPMILAGDQEALKDRLLRGICDGSLLPAVAWQERPGDIEIVSVATTAIKDEHGWSVSGNKHFVTHAPVADGYVVVARHEDAFGLYWVEKEAQGARPTKFTLADGTEHGSLHFDRARASLLMTPQPTPELLNRAMDTARIAASAELVGIASTCLEITLDYLRARTQFGKLIGSFQALQHRAVNLYVQKELATSALWEAVHGDEHGVCATKRAASASKAKARASSLAMQMAKEAIQMHGAIAWTDECDVGLFVKRAIVLSAWLGASDANVARYARLTQHGDEGR